MTGQCQWDIVGRHSRTVVAHANQFAPAIFERNLDDGGAGIDGILDELLHDRRRAFDDLAGGDLIGD